MGKIIRPDQLLQSGQFAALAGGGVYGTPSGSNPYITREYLQHAQHLEVCQGGKGDFTSVRDAALSITDASPTKPYVLSVHPGVYVESPFQIPSYVSIVAVGGYYNTQLQTSDNNNHFIVGSPASELIGLGILGPSGTGYAAVYYETNSNLPLKLVNCIFRGGYYGIWNHLPGVTGRSRVHLIHCGNMFTAGYVVQRMIYGTGRSNTVIMDSAIMSGINGHVLIGYSINGTDAEMVLDNSAFRQLKGTGGDTLGIEVIDGSLRGKSVTIANCTTGVRVNGTASVHMLSCELVDDITGNHIEILSSSSKVVFGGKADKNKILNSGGGSFIGTFSDETAGEEGQVVLGELWLGATADASIPMRSYGLAAYDTGWVSGGQVTVGPGTREVLVSSGYGYVNNGTSVQKIEWDAVSLNLGASESGYVFVTAAGVVQFSITEPSYETNIILAAVGADATTIVGVAEHRIPIKQITPRLETYIEEVIGPICGFGLITTEHAAPSLSLAVDTGSYFRGNTEHLITGGAPITFTRVYRNGTGGHVFVPGQTTIDSAYWDDGSGTLAAVPAGQFTRDLLYINKTPSGEAFYYVYSQETYASQILAETGNNPIPPGFLQRYGMRLAAIITESGSSDIASISDQRPFLGQFASGSTAVTDHGGLSGLSDDDHTQYLTAARGDARYPSSTDFTTHTGASSGVHGVVGSVVGTSDTQIVSNKTLNETDSIRMDVTANEPAYALGTIFWDSANQTIGIHTSPDTTLQVGQEDVALCRNAEAVTITNGQVVRISGATGDRPNILLATASTEVASYAVGVATQDIISGGVGFVTIRGIVHGINTLGYTEGDLLYLGTTPGSLTPTKPVPPDHACVVGRALNSKANGSLWINVSVGHEVDELHDALITSKLDGDLLTYEQATNLWKNKQPQFPVDKNTFGFLSRSETNISFDGVNSFTIAPTGTSWTYYRSGSRHTITGSKNVQVASPMVNNTQYYIYLDSTDGTLSSSTSPWTLNDTKVPVATIFWNATLTPNYIFCDERHTCTVDRTWHREHHLVERTQVISGGAVTGLTPGSDLDTDRTFGISGASIVDEDLFFYPSALVEPTTYFNLYRTSTTTYAWASTDLPFKYADLGGGTYDYIEYDNNGTSTPVTPSNYVNTYLILVNSVANNEANPEINTASTRYLMVQGRGSFSTAALAYGESFSDFDFVGFPLAEAAVVYQLTWVANRPNTVKGRCQFVSIQRVSGNTGAVALSVPSHNSLSGIQGGTPTERYHLSATELTSFSGHLLNTSNPHSVTASQVGNTVAQWNANQIQSKTVAAPTAVEDQKYLKYDHASGAFIYTAPAGTGDVSGPASAVADNFASFNGAGGKLIKDSGYGPTSFVLATAAYKMVHKINDQSKSNDANLANDTELFFTLLANTKYMFRMKVFYDTTAAGDFKWRHTGSGASTSLVRIKRNWIVPSGTALAGIAVDQAFSAVDLTVTTNQGPGGYIEAEGIIVTTGTPGTFYFQWAQNTSDAGPTIVRAGSYIEWMVVA